MSTVKEFGAVASWLSRNPLGVIALFIVLVYGIAALVLGTTADDLGPTDRRPLIWFLVLFPVIVLAVFAWLVSRHHQKLYAPFDYKTDDAFLRTLSPEAQRRRLDEEVAQLEEEQRSQQADEVRPSDPAAHLSSSRSDVERYRTEAVLAEDLVCRQLEAEYGIPIRRYAVLKIGSNEVQMDGLMVRGGQPFLAVEVKLFREALIRKNLGNRIAEIAASAQRLESLGVPLLVAIVESDLSSESRHFTSRELNHSALGLKHPIDVRFFDFDDLQRRFGVRSGT